MLQNTITYTKKSKSSKYQVEASLELVTVFMELQRFSEALDLLSNFETELHSIENKKIKMKYYELKEEICRQLGQYEMAYDALKQHMDLYKEVNNLMAEKAVNDVMAREYAKSIRRLETIATVGRELTMHSNVDEVLLEVKEILSELMDINGIGIGEIIGDNIEYNHYIIGETKMKPKHMKINDPSSLASWCIQNNREVKVNDIDKEYSLYIKDITRMDTDNSNISQEEQKKKESQKVKSVLYAPLIVKNEIIGVFTIQSNKVNAYMTEEFELFKIIASYVAIAFKNVNQSMALESLSIRDSLTNMYNRRGFTDFYTSLAEDKDVVLFSVAIIMVDLDYFKRINDIYGHLAGDMVLVEVGKILTRREDQWIIAGRLGGEEFGLILFNQGKEAVVAFAESLCEEVKAMSIKFENDLIQVTTSVGVSYKTYNDHLTYKELYHLADQALYQAKKLGRNRVICS